MSGRHDANRDTTHALFRTIRHSYVDNIMALLRLFRA